MRKPSLKEKAPNEQMIKKTFLFMLRTAWKNRPSIYLCYLIRLLTQIIQKLLPVLLPKFILDELVICVQTGHYEGHIKAIMSYVILYVALQLTCNYLSNISDRLISLNQEWFNEYFDVTLTDHTIRLDYQHTEDPEALDALNKAREGISWYSNGIDGILGVLNNILVNLFSVATVVIIILTTCPWLLPVQFVGLLLISWFNAKINKIETESFLSLSKINRIFGYIFYQLASFQLGKDIRLYNSAEMMQEKGSYYRDELVGVWKDVTNKQLKHSCYMNIVNALRDGISYLYIGWLAVSKRISIGDFSMCASSASLLYGSLESIIRDSQNIVKHCNYAYRYVSFLDYPVVLNKGTRSVLPDSSHVIEFRNVSFRYPRTERYILRNINLTIRSGEHLSIVGLNGAGKTTLIKLLCRLYDVTEGEILVDNVNIKEYSETEYRKLFAVVFQDFTLFAFSLRENIELSNPSDEKRLEEALRLSGLYEDAQKLDMGYDTMLFKGFDEKGTELSGGQQQKVAISRALYHNAPIVILDEPTAALDPVAEYEIYHRFDELVGGKTAVYISHRLSSCKFCDRIAVFAEDTIKEYGTHEELVHLTNGIYAEMFAAQAHHYIDLPDTNSTLA